MLTSEGTTSRIDILPSGALTVISPRGDLDIPMAGKLAAAVERVLGADPLMVVLDLRGLDFIDTTGIAAVIGAGRRCESRRLDFFLIRGAPHIDRVLGLAGLDGRFEVLSDLEHLGLPR